MKVLKRAAISHVPKIIITFVIIGLATILQWIAWPTVQPLAYFFYYPAIIIASVLGYGLLAIALSIALAQYFFVPPVFSFQIESWQEGFRIVIFAISAFMISRITDKLRISQKLTKSALVEQEKARQEAEKFARRLSAQYEVMNVLTGADTLKDAIPSILKIICLNLGWDFGVVWLVDETKQFLRAGELWHPPEIQVPEFIQITLQTRFSIGKGLPGQVWKSGEPAWITNVVHDPNFPRFKIAQEEGLHSALGFPILGGETVLGVIEFFSKNVRSPDSDLIKTTANLGGQIGQYLEKMEIEKSLKRYRDELEQRVEERTSELRKSEERNRLIVGSIRDYAIFSLDLEGRITSWNPGAERLKGYSADEIIGKHFSIFYPKEDLDAGKAEMELKVALVEHRFEDVGWRIRKDGSRFWANLVIYPIMDKTDKVIGFVKVTRDLTERKRAQELEEAIDVRDEFLSVASHELKTPITSLHLQHQLLRRIFEKAKQSHPDNFDKIPPLSAPVYQQMLKGIEKSEQASKKLIGLLDDLLDISRIRIGQLTIKKQDSDLVRLTRDVIESFSTETNRLGITIKVFTDAPSLIGKWDPVRVGQVVTNLISNALKYGEHKPIEIYLEENKTTQNVRLIIKDFGMGIPHELLPKIFHRFERAVPSSKISGLGLGLYIVHQIVQAHGGFINVESEIGKGSTFTVQLPLTERSAETKMVANL